MNAEPGYRTFDPAIVFSPRIVRGMIVATIVLFAVLEAMSRPNLPLHVRVDPRIPRSLRPRTPRPDSSDLSAEALVLLEQEPGARRAHDELAGVRVYLTDTWQYTNSSAATLVSRSLVLPDRERRTYFTPSHFSFVIENTTDLAVTNIWIVAMRDGVSYGDRCAEQLVPDMQEFRIDPRSSLVTIDAGTCQRRGRVSERFGHRHSRPTLHVFRVDFSDGTSVRAHASSP